MNICECYVVKVLGEPYYKHDKWWVKCEFNSHGRVFEQTIMFNDYKSVSKVKKGYLVHL